MARVITAPGIVRNVSKYLNTMRRVPFAIGKDDWVENSGTFTYEFMNAYVTSSSFEIGTYDHSYRDYAKADVDMDKKSGGGGMVFTTTARPSGTISGSLYVWDNNDNKIPVILEDTVVPVENGGTDSTTVAGIRSKIGLSSASSAKTTLGFGDTVLTNVANNLTTTSSGYVLDARQGKQLSEQIATLQGQVIKVKRKTGTATVNANSYVEYSLSDLGFTTPTGYTICAVIPSFSGSGTSAVITADVSDVSLGYVCFKNLSSSSKSINYAINVIYTPSGNVQSL